MLTLFRKSCPFIHLTLSSVYVWAGEPPKIAENGPLVPMVRLVPIGNDVIPVVVLVNIHSLKNKNLHRFICLWVIRRHSNVCCFNFHSNGCNPEITSRWIFSYLIIFSYLSNFVILDARYFIFLHFYVHIFFLSFLILICGKPAK